MIGNAEALWLLMAALAIAAVMEAIEGHPGDTQPLPRGCLTMALATLAGVGGIVVWAAQHLRVV